MINKIAIIGLGQSGKLHLKLLAEHEHWKLSGIYDINERLTNELADMYQVKAFNTLEDLLNSSDAVCILTPVNTRYEIARQAVMAGCHVFIEKPLTFTLKEARQLQLLVNESGTHFHVNNSERFNPAFLAAQSYFSNPRFIEIQRSASFSKTPGYASSVVQSLMINDLDLVLSVVKANVRRVSASGTPLLGGHNDLVNARIEFDNGAVASLTTNRMAAKNERKLGVFTDKNFVSVNLIDKTTQVISLKDAAGKTNNPIFEITPNSPRKELVFEHPVILPTNAINNGLTTFYQGTNAGKISQISLSESVKALELALEIEEKISA